eukprot:8502192-Alexandrium_andersonii.AAC.1
MPLCNPTLFLSCLSLSSCARMVTLVAESARAALNLLRLRRGGRSLQDYTLCCVGVANFALLAQ